MPSIIAEPETQNMRLLEPKNRTIGWKGEDIARSCQVTTQLRPNGEGGYLRTVRRRNKFSCTTTTHHRHEIKSSNSYETSKVEDQSKSEGLTIEVNCTPQYQREYSGRDYDCAKGKINGSSEPQLPEITPRSSLRIGQHQNKHQTSAGGAVTRVSICNTHIQDNNIRPSKMQKVIPTSLLIMDEAKHRNKTQLVDNIKANETSYEQFITDEGNRKLRRKIFRSHNYHKTVTKTNKESNESMGSTELTNYRTFNENHQNVFPTYHVDRLHSKITRERQEMGNDHSTSTLPTKIEICNDWCRRPRNLNKIIATNELTAIDTQNIPTTYNSSTQTSNKYELRSNVSPVEIIRPHDTVFTSLENSSSLTESNSTSNPSRAFSQKTFSNNEGNLDSRHKAYSHINNYPPSYTLPPTVISIPEYPKKNQESEQKVTAESYSTVSTDEHTVNLKAFKQSEIERIYSSVTDCEIKNHSSLPCATFRKISQRDSGKWQNKENWRNEESSSDDFTSQLIHDTSKRKWNLTGLKEFPLSSCNRRPSKESSVVYSNSINDSREESLTDEDRSMNEFVIKQSKQKEQASQYYFGIPTANVRTKGKDKTDDIIVSSSSFGLPSIEKLTPEELISQRDRDDYRESWSGSEHQTMEWSSTKENSDNHSFFKETRTRKGPIEVCFSIKSRCQTRTIAEPYVKEASKSGPQTVKNMRKEVSSSKQDVSWENCSDKANLWGRSASENENETIFSREVKTSKDPMEVRFSVTSFEQQRVLRENARNEQSGQSIKKQERVKKLVEETKNSMKESRVEVEEQATESERKRKKSSIDIRKECPVEVLFSVKPRRKEKHEQDKKLEKPIPSQVNFQDMITKEDTFEEILVRKLTTLRETTKSDSKRTNTSMLVVPKLEQGESLTSAVTKQSSIDGKRTINNVNPSEKSIIQRKINQRTDDSFETPGKCTETKGSNKGIHNPPLLSPISSSYFSKFETQIMNDLADTKESLSKIIAVRTVNESTDVKNRRNYEIPFNSAGYSINKYSSAFKRPSSKFFKETNIITKPSTAKENPLKTNVTEICNKFSTNLKSRDISKDEIITTANKYPIKKKVSKGLSNSCTSEDMLKITDITAPLKSPIYLKQLLYETLNTQSSLALEPDVEEINVKKSNVSTDLKYHSALNVPKMQRHLLSSLDTNSEFFQQDENRLEETTYRCEYKLKPNDHCSTAMDNRISTTNQNTIVCYLQPQPSHRGFKVKSWKEEIIINRMLLDVEKIDKSTKNEVQENRTSNHFFKIAPTDWARSTDYNNFQLTSENNGNATEKAPQGNVFCSKAIETGNTASQRTRDLHIKSLKTRSNTEMADNNSRLPHHSNNSIKTNKNHLGLHSMGKELKRNDIKPDIQCIYETSL